MKSQAFRFVRAGVVAATALLLFASMAAAGQRPGPARPVAAVAVQAPAPPAPAPAVLSAADITALKGQMTELQSTLNRALQQMFQNRPFTVLEAPKATYLPGFGMIVHTEVSLYHIVMLPMPVKLYEEQFKTEHAEKIVRVAALRKKLPEVLLDEAGRLDERAENVAIIVHLFNPRPYSEVPDQIIVQAPLSTLRDLKSRKAGEAEIMQAITMREF